MCRKQCQSMARPLWRRSRGRQKAALAT